MVFHANMRHTSTWQRWNGKTKDACNNSKLKLLAPPNLRKQLFLLLISNVGRMNWARRDMHIEL